MPKETRNAMSAKTERETKESGRGCGCGCGRSREGGRESEDGGGVPWTWIRIGVSAAALALGLLAAGRFAPDPAWVAVLLCGIPIVREAVEGLVERLDVKADLLVAVALAASLAVGETFAAGEVALIIAGLGLSNGFLSQVLYYLYQFFGMFSSLNLGLALFNLLPIPPLDGYHVLNDILLKGKLQLSPDMFRMFQLGLMALLVFTNVVDRLLFTLRSAVWTPVIQFFTTIVFGR